MRLKVKRLRSWKKIPPIIDGFVVCGDVHLYNFLPFSEFDDNKVSSRLLDIRKAFVETVDCANELDLPLFVNGDLITGRRLGYPVLKVLTELRDYIQDCEVHTYINLGNHDLDGNTTMLEPLFTDCKYINLVGTGSGRFCVSENINLVCMPYCGQSGVKKALSEVANLSSEDLKYNVLGLHMGFKGALYTATASETGLSQGPFRENGIVGKHFDIIVASHFHRHQIIAGGHGFYTGSLLPIDFGERGKDHGYHVVDLGKRTRYFVRPKDMSLFKIVKMSNVSRMKNVKGNYVKVQIDSPEFDIVVEKSIRKLLLGKGARGVVFSKVYKEEVEDHMGSYESITVEEIVSKFSKTKAEQTELDPDKLESIGLNILERAKEKRTLSARLSDV